MGISIRIGSTAGGFDEREFGSAGKPDEAWIAQAIGSRRRDGLSVVVEIAIKTGTLDLFFRAPKRPAGGGGRPATEQELAIIHLWEKRGPWSADFAPGQVVAFLKQARDLL